MISLARFFHWLGHPFRCCARAFTALINMTQTQIRALFSLGMLGGIIALSFQNMALILIALGIVPAPDPRTIIGRMILSQQLWNNAIMAGFGLILGMVVWGADYFRASVEKKELEMRRDSAREAEE